MLLLSTHTFPLETAPDVAKTFIKIEGEGPLPSYIKRLGPYLTHAGELGIKGTTIYEVEKGNEDEALKEIWRRWAQFSSLAGQKFKLETVLPAEDAIATLGL